jgi:hypothetical protein
VVPRTARKLLSRLSRMSWDEIETRLRQEFSKRLDVALCGMGLQPGRNGLRLSSEVRGNFFFTPPEISHRVNLLRERMPEQAAQIVADADEIRSHRFRLLGYRDLSYGEEIDWHLDAVHGLRSPLIPWFKIDFLKFEEVGDHKVTWELNRHQHMVTLAKAWLLTGETAYADEIFSQWYSWKRANPYPLGANWASSLEAAFRSLSWIWVDHMLAGYGRIPAGFKQDLLHGLALHGRHIERYLSTYFSPNTHLLGEAVVLFFIGTLYPEISSARRWEQLGWRIVQEEAVRQVRPDGVYFEQTLYYHVYALDFLVYARLLASRNGLQIPAGFDQIIRRMLAVIAALSQAGPPEGFGDDDGGRLFDSSRNRTEYITDPLALGSALFHGENLRARAGVTEEAIWLFGDDAFPPEEKGNPHLQLNSASFPDGGVYVIASSEQFSQQLVVDAGPQGTGHCGHGHADALSVRLSFAGRRWLVDAGTGCYIGPGDERDMFRGTRAHNTLAVDGLDQAQPEGPFAWTAIPKIEVESFISRPTFSFFVASHSGYERMPQPVRHRRFIFHFERNLYLIRDVALGEGTHLLETSWHFAPDLEVSQAGNAFVAEPRDDAQHGRLLLVPVEDSRWNAVIRSELVSPAYGEKINAPVLRCSAGVPVPAEAAMLLGVNIERAIQPIDVPIVIREPVEPTREAPDAVYRYQQGNTQHLFVFAPSTAKWGYGKWSSDAQFLYVRAKGGYIDKVFLCGGSVVHFQAETVISHRSALQWLEWNNEGGGSQVACSDDSAVQAFNAGILGKAKI